MAYFLSGVGVEILPQATRPREPARPSRAMVMRSPEMATRQLRPREAVPPWVGGGYLGAVLPTLTYPSGIQSPVPSTTSLISLVKPTTTTTVSTVQTAAALTTAKTAIVPTVSTATVSATNVAHVNALLQQIASLKGQQAALETLLRKIGTELTACKAVLQRAILSGSKTDIARAEANLVTIGRAVDSCIAAIKACAANANNVANAAIGSGASREVVQAAAAAGTKSIAFPTVISEKPRLPTNIAIETNTPGIKSDGTITVGPDATLVDAGAQSDPSVLAPQDVNVSSGSIGTIALVGVAGLLGYLMLRKKGRV